MPSEPGFGFEPSALPLGHVAEMGRALGPSVTGQEDRIAVGLVGNRVNAHFGEPFLKMGIPVILDLIVSSFGQMSCNGRPPEITQKINK